MTRSTGLTVSAERPQNFLLELFNVQYIYITNIEFIEFNKFYRFFKFVKFGFFLVLLNFKSSFFQEYF